MRPLPSAAINGVEANRFPHVFSVYLPEVEASALVRRAAGSVAVSMGSACSTNDIEPSHVLVAMGLEDRAHSTVRISFGRYTTHDDVRAGMAQLSMAHDAVRVLAGALRLIGVASAATAAKLRQRPR